MSATLVRHLKAMGVCLGIALVMKILNVRIFTPGGSALGGLVQTALAFAFFLGIPVLTMVSGRVRETMHIAAIHIFVLPTPLIGAAKAFRYFVLGMFLIAAEGFAHGYDISVRTFQPGFSGGLMGDFLFAFTMYLVYLTLGQTFIEAWASAGRKTALYKRFNEAAAGFPHAYRYHDKEWCGFAINPAERKVVVSARRIVDGDAGGQSPEVLSFDFNDIADYGYCIPGFSWQGMIVGAGAFAAGSSFVASFNDLNWQRVKGSFNTGLWFALTNGESYMVQAKEKHVPALYSVLEGTIK